MHQQVHISPVLRTLHLDMALQVRSHQHRVEGELWTQKQRKKTACPWKASARPGPPARYPHLPCQPLNEAWEDVDPGSTLSGYSGALHAAELPWVGPAFPPGAQSLLQAMT